MRFPKSRSTWHASTVAAVIGLSSTLVFNNPAPAGSSTTSKVGQWPARAHHMKTKIITMSSPTPPPAPTGPPTSPNPAPAAPLPAPDPNSCAAAISYLQMHANPAFHIQCPGHAAGHQAMTCINHAGLCAGEHLIAIAVPCPASYENEARNSYILTGQSGYMGHALDEHPQGCPLASG